MVAAAQPRRRVTSALVPEPSGIIDQIADGALDLIRFGGQCEARRAVIIYGTS